ncbi:hypothetical protein EJ05DRAFT_496105 [Pseudovirgaria hyperparasitica]|uniref:Uncharacterized protein n=1 Tax=Pseudovirgaria hyperparasitica TaxID=470096 RepID=A0A6A6WMN1_9PEZI|nr:uncharacterized protein EJ05DRAFT_496105 [Pseudovirgaria hyperparasitica]KAF2763279.1 hypothetical protein EJ05DRAFT_496105 [Pseudovirgaria hyperparasitica]
MTFFHFSYKNRGRKSPTPSSSTEGSRGSAQTPSSMKSFQNNAQAPSSTTKNFQNIAQAPRGPPQYQYSSPSLRQNVPVDAAASIPPPYAAPQPAPPLNPLWCPPPTYQQFHEQQQQYLEATRQQRIQAEWMASQPQPPFRTNPTSRPASFHQHFHQHQQHQYINGMGQQGPHTDWTTNPLNLPMRPSTATRPPSFHQSFLQQHQHQYVDGTRQQRPQAEWMSSPLYMPVRSNTATPPSPLQNHYAASLDQTYPNPMYQSYPYNPPNHPMTPRAAATFPQPQLSQLMYASPAPLTPLTPQQTGPLQPQPQPYYVKTKPSGAALSSIYKPIKKASTTMLNLQHSVMENKGGGLIEKADTWYESVSTKLDDMITGMDEEQFVAEEGEGEIWNFLFSFFFCIVYCVASLWFLFCFAGRHGSGGPTKVLDVHSFSSTVWSGLSAVSMSSLSPPPPATRPGLTAKHAHLPHGRHIRGSTHSSHLLVIILTWPERHHGSPRSTIHSPPPPLSTVHGSLWPQNPP